MHDLFCILEFFAILHFEETFIQIIIRIYFSGNPFSFSLSFVISFLFSYHVMLFLYFLCSFSLLKFSILETSHSSVLIIFIFCNFFTIRFMSHEYTCLTSAVLASHLALMSVDELRLGW